jgi:hypothetical protein
MSMNNLLHEYLDTGLDSGAEESLFAELSRDAALRSEFNRHLQLQMIARQDMSTISPPGEVTGAVFSSLGFSVPGELQKSKPGFLKKNLAVLLLLLLVSAAGTGGYFLYNENSRLAGELESAKSELASAREIPTVSSTAAENAGLAITSENNSGPAFSNSSANSGMSGKFAGTGNYAGNAANSQMAIGNDGKRESFISGGDKNSQQGLAENSTAGNDAALQVMPFDYSGNHLIQGGYENYYASNGVSAGNPGGMQMAGIPINSSIQLYGTDAGSEIHKISLMRVGDNEVDAIYGFAIRYDYRVAENLSIGAEYGRDRFFQSFDSLGGSVTVNQSPILTWYGANISWTPDFGIYERLDFQLGGGAAWSVHGPVINGNLLASYRLIGNVSIVAGYRQNWLIYNVGGELYNSNAGAFTGGLRIGF